MIDGLRSNYINDIMTDSKNRVWYSCHTGISVYDGKDSKTNYRSKMAWQMPL